MGCVMYVMILYDKLRHSLSLRRLHSLRMVRVDDATDIPMVKWIWMGWRGRKGVRNANQVYRTLTNKPFMIFTMVCLLLNLAKHSSFVHSKLIKYARYPCYP
jgi:hypothetical protein